MASITAELNKSAKPNKDGEYVIRMAIHWRGTKYVGIGHTSKPEHWDSKTLKAKKSHPDRERVNEAIKSKMDQLFDIMRKLDDLPGKFSAADVIHIYKGGELPGVDDRPGQVLTEFKSWVDSRKDISYKYGYYNLLDRLQEYENTNLQRPLEFADIDADFEQQFRNFLLDYNVRGQGKGYMNATINRFFTYLKAFMTIMSKKHKGKIQDDFRDYKVKPEKKRTKFYLTEEQLTHMQNLPLDNTALSITRDRYCFSCWTGLRFSDAIAVGDGNIIETPHGLAIRKVQKKTGTEVEIPLTAQAIEILDRYPGRRIPPQSNGTANRNIKLVGVRSGLMDSREKVRKRGAEEDVQKGPFYEFLTYHTSRSTFAILMLQRGVDPLTVMSVGGWESWDVFKNNYVDIANDHKHKAIHKAAAAIAQDAEQVEA